MPLGTDDRPLLATASLVTDTSVATTDSPSSVGLPILSSLGGGAGAVTSVAGKVGAVLLAATDISSGTLAAARMPAHTGDVTSSAGSVALTLVTVNSNVGSFRGAKFTVNAKGLVTAVTGSSRVFNVLDYGAVGDGSNNDTTAIQAAITAALAFTDDGAALGDSNCRACVYFPAGRYKITNELTVPASSRAHVYFRGDGMYASIIQQYTAGKNAFTIDMSHAGYEGTRTASTTYHLGISDLGFQAMVAECGTAVKITYSGTATVNAGSFVVGQVYTILTVGSTSFTAIGAASNTVGLQFTATGVGSGSGTATTGGEPEGSSHQAAGPYLDHVAVLSCYQNVDGWWAEGFDLEGAWNAVVTHCFLSGFTMGTRPTVTGPNFVIGNTYLIATTGGTSFTSIGASSNTVGVYFVATGPGTGITGTATLLYAGTAIKTKRLMCNAEVTNTQANFWSLGFNWNCVDYINPVGASQKGKNVEGLRCSNVWMVSVGRGVWLQGNPNQVAAPRGSYFAMFNSHIDARGGPAAQFDYWQGVHFIGNLLIASDSIGTWDAVYGYRLKQSVIANNVFAICVNGVQLADTSLGNLITDNIGEACSNSLVELGSSTTVNTVRGNRMNDGTDPVIYDNNSAAVSNQIEGTTATVLYNPGPIGANDSRWTDITASGAQVGQVWTVIPPFHTDSFSVTVSPISAGTVRVVLSNVWYASRTIGTVVSAGSFTVGQDYTICTVGTTSFTSIGASSNTVGVQFTATGAGSGSGTAALAGTWKIRRVY